MTTTRITSTAAALLSLAAAGAPTAAARPIDDPAFAPNRAAATVYSRPDKSLINLTTPQSDSPTRDTNPPQAVVRIQTPHSGFDWGDAGIGAAGGLALAMLGLGGGLVASQRRGRARQSTGLPR